MHGRPLRSCIHSGRNGRPRLRCTWHGWVLGDVYRHGRLSCGLGQRWPVPRVVQGGPSRGLGRADVWGGRVHSAGLHKAVCAYMQAGRMGIGVARVRSSD